MSQPEWLLHLEDYRRRPWGEDIADLRTGIIAATVANCHSTGKTYSPADFIPRFTPEREQTDEEIQAAVDAAFGAMRGS